MGKFPALLSQSKQKKRKKSPNPKRKKGSRVGERRRIQSSPAMKQKKMDVDDSKEENITKVASTIEDKLNEAGIDEPLKPKNPNSSSWDLAPVLLLLPHYSFKRRTWRRKRSLESVVITVRS